MSALDDLIKIVQEESFSEEMEQLGHDAKKELETMQATLRDLHDTNTALVIYNRRIRLVLNICTQIFNTLETDGALFIPQSTQTAIKQAREQVAKLDHSLASSVEICDTAPTLVTADVKTTPLNS